MSFKEEIERLCKENPNIERAAILELLAEMETTELIKQEDEDGHSDDS